MTDPKRSGPSSDAGSVIAGGTWFFVGVSEAPTVPRQTRPPLHLNCAGRRSRARDEDAGEGTREEAGPYAGAFPIGTAAREAGQLDMAIGYLRRAVQHEPAIWKRASSWAARFTRRATYRRPSRRRQKILESSPNNVDALYNMGAIYANQGDAVKARSYWTAA